MRHFKECIPTRENACAALSNAQSKLKRNAALLRQVGNLKRQNLSLRKANKALRLQVKLDEEAKDKLNLLAEVAEIGVRKPYFCLFWVWNHVKVLFTSLKLRKTYIMMLLKGCFTKVNICCAQSAVLTEKKSYTTLA